MKHKYEILLTNYKKGFLVKKKVENGIFCNFMLSKFVRILGTILTRPVSASEPTTLCSMVSATR